MNNKPSHTNADTGDAKLDQLLDDISHPDVKVRRQASVELGVRSDLRTVYWLLELLDHTYQTVQNSALDTLQRIGVASVPLLIANLTEQSVRVRCKIMMLLGMFRSYEGIAPLVAALDDPHEYVRSSAASALGAIGDPIAFEPLLNALHSADIGLAAQAAIALGKLGDSRAVSQLRIALRSPQATIRIGVTTGLGYLGNREAVADILPLLHERSDEIRYAAVMALGRLGDQKVVTDLSRLAQTDGGFSADLEPIAATAAIVAGKLGGIWSLDAIYTTIADTQIEDLYAWAIHGLCVVHPDSAVEVLIDQLRREDAFRRFHAVVALGVIGDPRAESPLMKIVHTDIGITSAGESIADAAMVALRRIREPQHNK